MKCFVCGSCCSFDGCIAGIKSISVCENHSCYQDQFEVTLKQCEPGVSVLLLGRQRSQRTGLLCSAGISVEIAGEVTDCVMTN